MEAKNKNELIEYIGYQISDLKILLLDIDCCTRGIGGVKKIFDVHGLPSYEKYNKNENIREETEEERLARHVKFFESLKSLAKNKSKED